MNEVKYEPIFGDQSLFDGAPDDAEYAGWFCQETRWYMILNGKILFSDGGTWCTSDNPYLSADIAAMRRIIKEPKRWTVADQKAERLPEVGSKVATIRNFDCTVVGVDEERKNIAIQYENGKLDVVRLNSVSQIETQAEKAQRLEDEFFEQVKLGGMNANTPQKTNSWFELGVRAAYRKHLELVAPKGGE